MKKGAQTGSLSSLLSLPSLFDSSTAQAPE
jgi:hypothetical protein